MQPWLKVSLLLCVFGFFRELRPSEPFVTEFLSGEWRDIEPEQLNRDVYPIGTYSHLALLVFMFLLTDVLRYDDDDPRTTLSLIFRSIGSVVTVCIA
uniref:Putative reduced folate carrier n=1 Tax=Anopheles marajoara TaxID=58244 RepID=A0A2M4C975_9DIPT